jgi:ribonuclease P protein component
VTDAATPSSARPSRGQRVTPRRRELPFGLPPWRRLRASRDFSRVERQGLRASGGLVAVTVRPGPGRIGLVVAKKVDNRAVARNRIKRRLRAILCAEKARFARRSEGTVDVVVTARPEAKGASFVALREDVLAALQAALARLSMRPEPPPRRR